MSAHKGRYISSLDGLRAFAVFAVIAYHLGMSWAPSGLLGVTIFFVLSGYLITGLLINEYNEKKTLDLPHFWLRRVRRLVPAIVTLIVVLAAICVLFNHVLLTKMRPDIVPSLFFFTNWWYIFRDVSYFEALGSPSPLTHFWSLAIEEQFYLIWPLLLLGMFKLGAGKKTVRRICLGLTAVSAILMAVLFVPDGDPSRVYYGTDTRAMSLLIGAWLAFMWPGQELTDKNTKSDSTLFRVMMDVAGIAALGIIIVIMTQVSPYSPFLYYGGILLVSLLTALLIGVLVYPQSILAKIAAWKPFVWIGKRSYGMYLWHYPLILLLTQRNHTEGYPWWYLLFIVALTIGIAALSYRFIEKPIRSGAIGNFVRDLKAGKIHFSRYVYAHALPVVVGAVVVLVAVGGCIMVPETSAAPGVQEAEANAGVAANQARDLSQGSASETADTMDNPQDTISDTTDEATTETTPAAAPGSQTVPSSEAGVYSPVLIGDSVPGRCVPYFNETFPNGLIDFYVGRRIYDGIDVYNGYVAQGVVGHVVIFELASNSAPTDEQFDDLIAAAGPDKEIFLITIVVPEGYQDMANTAIWSCAGRYSNVHVIDWVATSAGHDEYFEGDGIHLNEEGAQVYTNMIAAAVAPYMT